MFSDQISEMPRPCDQEWPSAKPWLANGTPLVPTPAGTTEGWGLSFSLSHQKSHTGRPAGVGSWEGIANLFWFADRITGIAGIIATQILPYGGMVASCRRNRLNSEADPMSRFWGLATVRCYRDGDIRSASCLERGNKV